MLAPSACSAVIIKADETSDLMHTVAITLYAKSSGLTTTNAQYYQSLS